MAVKVEDTNGIRNYTLSPYICHSLWSRIKLEFLLPVHRIRFERLGLFNAEQLKQQDIVLSTALLPNVTF